MSTNLFEAMPKAAGYVAEACPSLVGKELMYIFYGVMIGISISILIYIVAIGKADKYIPPDEDDLANYEEEDSLK